MHFFLQNILPVLIGFLVGWFALQYIRPLRCLLGLHEPLIRRRDLDDEGTGVLQYPCCGKLVFATKYFSSDSEQQA
jgi:hypothetical protein